MELPKMTWIKYDPDNPPRLDKTVFVIDKDGMYETAWNDAAEPNPEDIHDSTFMRFDGPIENTEYFLIPIGPNPLVSCGHRNIQLVTEMPIGLEHEFGHHKHYVKCEDCKEVLDIQRVTKELLSGPFIEIEE